ncbi:FxsA family protein [Paenibacillus senegalensis]|uniref:FxsA family protein n=1 Tax=Paenibacillus senegalensis TaxID=1465766 RepID=UPI0002883765|nr:FxsA family protein [Paenibacillus senegalensis]
MRKWLIAIIILVPALEIWGIITVSRWLGGGVTFLLMILTGLLGVYWAKREGRRVWQYAQQQASMGQRPTAAILDGICIFIGGILLIAPGFFTDIVGIFLLLPFTRNLPKRVLYRLIERMMSRGNFMFFVRR